MESSAVFFFARCVRGRDAAEEPLFDFAMTVGETRGGKGVARCRIAYISLSSRQIYATVSSAGSVNEAAGQLFSSGRQCFTKQLIFRVDSWYGIPPK